MGPTKLTNTPTGLEYYRVCDEEGVCRVVKGMWKAQHLLDCLLYTSPSPRDVEESRMPSSA